MSEDDFGLDKAARLAAQETGKVEPLMRIEPGFPFELLAFDTEFWEPIREAR